MQVGSLFAGIGGFDLGFERAGFDVAWCVEWDKNAQAVLRRRFPNAQVYGDIREVDPSQLAPVDVICGGFPCQDVSSAGKRAGIKAGTRSGLWSVFADAIDALRPQWVVIENVRGLLSATAHRTVEDDADCDVEPAAGAVGDGAGRPVLRAAGAVLGDLADLGYDAQWATVAAADVGAPHRRERVFILAADTSRGELQRRGISGAVADPAGRGEGASEQRQRIASLEQTSHWGKYEPAIRRWESIVGPAPAPTEPNRSGNPRLSATFSEWLMGWPSGWVTHPAIGISRNDQLRIIGNGVCPQQATAALHFLLAVATGTHTHTLGRADMTPTLPTPCARDYKDGDSAGVHARNTPSLGAVSAYFEVGE